MKPQTVLNQWIVSTLIFMSLITIGYGQSSIDLTYSNASSNTVFSVSSINNGKKVYSHMPTSNLQAGGVATLIINVTEISGNPQAELTMWNPNNRNEFWYSPGPQSLTLGQNILTVGPNEAMTYFRYEIKMGSSDQIKIDSFGVQGYDLINNSTVDIELFDGSFDGIQWTEEVVDNPANNEIQDYLKGFARINDDGDLVLKIARNNINQYKSSRLNSSPTNIALQSGEKLSVEFEAKLPRPEDINGNFVSNTPIWPALWIMGREVFDGNIGWPYCGEIDAMEWSPTRSTGTTAFSSAYHWNDWDYIESGNQRYNSFNTYHYEALYNNFNKWRVDIYRYDDGINTNKIEMFFNDVLISGSRITMNDNNQEFWWPVTNRNPQTFNQNSPKNYIFIMNIAIGGNYPGINNPVPSAFDHAEMLVRNVDYSISSLEGASTTGQTQAIQWSQYDGAQLNGSNFSYPDWAESWAGFQNINGDVFAFPHGGRITFNARTIGGLSQNGITFTFENDRYPDNTPQFTTSPVTVNSTTTASYSVDIPAQNANQVFKSFLLKLTNRTSGSQALEISNVTIETFEEAPLEDIYQLTINYDPLKVAINKFPSKTAYYENEIVQVEATPLPGYVLGDSSWLSKSILMDDNKTYTISVYNDYSDSDSDGLNNYAEVQNRTDPNDPDSDNDGLNDGDEITNGTDPNIADYTLDLTYDSSKLSVIKIPNHTTYPSGSSVSIEATPQPGYVLGDFSWLSKSILMDDNKTFTISVYNDYNDNDSDGLNNYAEAQNGTDLNNTDSDGDGSNDYFEWVAGTDPNNASAHFKIQNFVIDQETFQLEYDSNFGRNYNILVSSDLNTWTEWKTLSGDGEKQITIFNNQEKINLGIDSTSKIYFFKVDIIKID
tara:strand:+ start:2449 stop:5109 length:2661 start_codon:yes stop_codon:yes gene_type:complete